MLQIAPDLEGNESSISSLEFKSECWWCRVNRTCGVWHKWPAMRHRAQVRCINHALTSWTISVPFDILRARGMELVCFECQVHGMKFYDLCELLAFHLWKSRLISMTLSVLQLGFLEAREQDHSCLATWLSRQLGSWTSYFSHPIK